MTSQLRRREGGIVTPKLSGSFENSAVGVFRPLLTFT